MVEIVKALSINAKIVIMDEPTSALTLREVDHLYAIIRQLAKARQGDHFHLPQVRGDFRDRRFLHDPSRREAGGRGKVAETTVDEIVRKMVGRSLDQMYPKSDVPLGEVALKVEASPETVSSRMSPSSCEKERSLGSFGLVGAGPLRGHARPLRHRSERRGTRSSSMASGSRYEAPPTHHAAWARIAAGRPPAPGGHPPHEHPGKHHLADHRTSCPSRVCCAGAWRRRSRSATGRSSR